MKNLVNNLKRYIDLINYECIEKNSEDTELEKILVDAFEDECLLDFGEVNTDLIHQKQEDLKKIWGNEAIKKIKITCKGKTIGAYFTEKRKDDTEIKLIFIDSMYHNYGIGKKTITHIQNEENSNLYVEVEDVYSRSIQFFKNKCLFKTISMNESMNSLWETEVKKIKLILMK